MINQIYSVPIVVRDQDRALKFYRDALGFEVTADTPTQFPDNRWITLRPPRGQTNIMLFKVSLDQPEMSSRIGKWTAIVLHTDNIRAACEQMKSQGVRITKEPERQPWGGIEAQFADPDGNTFELVEPPR